MSERTKPTTLKLVKNKSWYIPGDTQTYKTLKSLGVPLVKIHVDMIPTLKLLFESRGIEARAQNFKYLLDKMLDKVGSQWQAKQGRTCRLAETRLLFQAKGDRHRKAFNALDVYLAKFFARWGYSYSAEFSETPGRMKMVVDYRFDPERNPIIPTVEAPVKTVTEFEMGFTKLRITFNDKPTVAGTTRTRTLPANIQVEVLEKAGSDWRPRYQSTCVDAQLGEVTQLMEAVAIIHQRRKVQEGRA